VARGPWQPSSSGAPERRSAGRRLRRGDGRVVVRLGADFLPVLDVLHLAVLAYHEDGARGEPGDRAVLDLDAVSGPEGALAEVRERLDGRHAGGAAPALLRKRQIAADRPDFDARAELPRLLVEAPRLGVAGRRVLRRHRAQDHDPAQPLAELHRRAPVSYCGEIGRLL